jgi:hypothetical protein
VSAPEHGALIDGVVRLSTLRTFDQCPDRGVREARWTFNDYSHSPAALGTAAHMVMEEMLRTLWRQGEDRMPTQEVVEIMREVTARPDCPHLSVAQLRDLRVIVLQLARVPWPAKRLVALEERLWADVPCPDGKRRKITGRPDAVFASPPHGAAIVDLKTSWAVPPAPRGDDATRDNGRPYLSERGTFQLDVQGLLIMRAFPAINHCTLREYYPRLNEIREATLERDDLEHVEQHLGLLAQRFEMSMSGELTPEPRPGKWCSHCSFVRECSVPDEDRGEGLLTSADAAQDEANRWITVRSLADTQRKTLKAFHEETGVFLELNDGRYVGWHAPEGKPRKFDAAAMEVPK